MCKTKQGSDISLNKFLVTDWQLCLVEFRVDCRWLIQLRWFLKTFFILWNHDNKKRVFCTLSSLCQRCIEAHSKEEKTPSHSSLAQKILYKYTQCFGQRQTWRSLLTEMLHVAIKDLFVQVRTVCRHFFSPLYEIMTLKIRSVIVFYCFVSRNLLVIILYIKT